MRIYLLFPLFVQNVIQRHLRSWFLWYPSHGYLKFFEKYRSREHLQYSKNYREQDTKQRRKLYKLLCFKVLRSLKKTHENQRPKYIIKLQMSFISLVLRSVRILQLLFVLHWLEYSELLKYSVLMPEFLRT